MEELRLLRKKAAAHLSILLFSLCASSLSAGLTPDYDKNCDAMLVSPCPTENFVTNGIHYHQKAVPRRIHRIWFGDQSKLSEQNRQMWKSYSETYGYKYKLWTEKDLVKISSIMSDQNFDLLKTFLNQHNWWSASDLLRLELIKTYGGIYIDCDFTVPQWNSTPIDFFQILSPQGLTLMLEHHGREIGSNAAVFVANGLIVAPQGHPVIVAACHQIRENSLSFYKNKGVFDAMYATGPFFLNRVLSGTYNVVPVNYLHQFKMF